MIYLKSFQVCSQRVPDSPIGTCQCQSGFGYEEDGVSIRQQWVMVETSKNEMSKIKNNF